MKFTFVLALIAASLVGATPLEKRASEAGFDISDYQPSVNFNTAVSNGAKWVYIKATEGTSYTSPAFSTQYDGATSAGLIRGAYHFAHPDESSGTTQASYFVAHGGGWSNDGITLPGALDIESNPSGAECYGLSTSAMVTWISQFSTEYHTKTGRYPVIYTTTSWWETCTGNSASFASNNPLWIARWASSAGTLPAGWSYYTFWQYDDTGVNPGDADEFNGSATQLSTFAKG